MKLKLFSIVYLVSLWLTSIHSQEKTLETIDEDYDNSPRFFKVRAKSGLVLREKPDRNSKKLAVLPDGEKGFVIGQTRKIERINGKEGRWFEIEYESKQGWIFSGYTITDFDSTILMEMEDEFFFTQK